MTDGPYWRDAVLAGETDPVVARDSATVVLLRPGPDDDFQVCLLRRAPTMRVGAGMYVFPGGTVDVRDADEAWASLPWVGPQPQQWATWLGGPPELAASLVYSAVRETFEESGVLLAGARDARVGADGVDPRSCHGQPVGMVLTNLELTVRADLLRPWSRWVTPRTERRRFDTRFFVAVIPPGQEPWVASSESDRLTWITPTEAVERWNEGKLPMALPTAETLRELAGLAATLPMETVLDMTRDMRPVEPAVRRREGDSIVLLGPDGHEYQPPRIAR